MQYTKLVNRKHPYSWKEEKKQILTSFWNVFDEEIWIEEETKKAFVLLQEFLKTKSIEIGIASSYRSVEEQTALFQEREKEVGKEETEKYVSHPFCSEHHTGLALDIAVKVNGIYTDESHEESIPIFEEIHPYLSRFGFILRYPKGKEEITGFSYVPWHIRYVGKLPAMIMEKYQLTLEEYVEDFSGVLYVNKEDGMTSFDVVKKISTLFGLSKVGHTGTLDPLAKGVMLIVFGKATKIVELLTSYQKEYIAKARLGISTDTGDITGTILEEKSIPSLDVTSALSYYQKTYLQEVPIYSAVKVNGKKLYEYAREGKEVNLPKKEVTIYEMELLEQNQNDFTFRTLVSKGCYIRSLIRDIGSFLGVPATMLDLVRTKQGDISIEECFSLTDIESGNFSIHMIPEVLKEYPLICVDQEIRKKIQNGNTLPNLWQIQSRVLFESQEGHLLGIYQEKDGKLVCFKNFSSLLEKNL